MALDRISVLRGAVLLADETGLDAISMRAVAARLGVVPMALYKHVADKEDLLSGMVDLVISEYEVPENEGSWRDSVRARVLDARAALRRHPWLRRAIETRGQRTEAVMSHMEAVSGDLIRGGLSVDLVHHAMHALGNRIWGYSPEAFPEDAPPPAGIDDPQQLMQAMAQRYPNIVAIAAETMRTGGACDDEFEFAFTLDLLLDAFEGLHLAGWTSRA